jgi:PIN domain nuclease of toxin-antitoxin system
MKQKLLLDTHVFVWAAANPARLGPKSRELIVTSDEVAVSSISIAEINMKAMLGNFTRPDNFIELLESAAFVVSDFGLGSAEELLRFGSLAKHDPFDRLILAQAAAGGYKLVTADARLLAQGLDFVLDAEI